MTKSLLFFILTTTLCVNADAQVGPANNIPVKNYTPIISAFALPQVEIQEFRASESLLWTHSFNVTNYISRTERDNESLILDGETWEYISKFRYSLNDRLQLGLELGFIRHSGGLTDNLIYEFHDIFGLPQNGRTDLQQDNLLWSISAEGNQIVFVDSPTKHITDTIFSLHWKPNSDPSQQINLAIKLPTGSVDEYSGSGKVDGYLSYAASNPEWFQNRSYLKDQVFSLWYGLGLGLIGHHEKLSSIKQNSSIFTLRGGVAWLVSALWEIKLQLDSQTPLYSTEFREFGWHPLQFTVGTTYRIGQLISFEFYLAEDLRPRTAPDVTFSSAFTVIF